MPQFERILQRLGPLAPLLAFLFISLSLFALGRLGLLSYFQSDVANVDKLWLTYPVGIRLDLILLCTFLFLPALLLFLLPKFINDKLRFLFAFYFSLLLSLFVFLELASLPFLNEYSSRPNQLFFQYLTHPKEVFSTVLKTQTWLVPIVFGLAIASFWLSWKLFNALLSNANTWTWKLRLLVLPLVIVALFLGFRSGTGRAAPNPGLAAYSSNHLANQIALNAGYSLLYAVYRATKSSIRSEEVYGTLPAQEIFKRVKSVSGIAERPEIQAEIPTANLIQPSIARDKPFNLVVIVMESMGAEFVGSLGGKPLTPNLDKLAQQGLSFSQMYSTGIRTYRGLEAILSGFPPTTHYSTIIKLNQSQTDFFTIGSLLKAHGYGTSFIYGGESHFDNMRGFAAGNGFEKIIDQKDFSNPRFSGSWGVSDEDLLSYANNMFRQQSKPFASVVLTLSNHAPFEFPEGDYTLPEQPINTPHNSAHYADYALGKFFAQAKQEAYFSETVFVLVADHPMLIRADSLVPVEKYHIPGIIIAPGLDPQKFTKVSSQLDIMPTALSLLGPTFTTPMIGHNLLGPAAQLPGRAIMQYDDNNAYRIDDQVIIQTPNAAARQFTIHQNEIVENEKVDENLRKDALAHALFPSITYHEQHYRLPLQYTLQKPTFNEPLEFGKLDKTEAQ